MTNLQSKVDELTNAQTLLKRQMAAAAATGDFQAVTQYAQRLGEIDHQLLPIQKHLSDIWLNELQEKFLAAEAQERQAKIDFDTACKEYDKKRKRLEDAMQSQLAPLQKAREEALHRKRWATEMANQARGKLSQAQRNDADHHAAHGQ